MSKERIKSEYFSLEELTHSSVGTASGLANEPGPQEVKNLQLLVTAVLDPLRRLLGRPITVTSGYRCRLLNTAVHGSPNSQHLTDGLPQREGRLYQRDKRQSSASQRRGDSADGMRRH